MEGTEGENEKGLEKEENKEENSRKRKRKKDKRTTAERNKTPVGRTLRPF